MQTEARPTTNLQYLDDSDQQALGLFNNLRPDQQHSSHQYPQPNHNDMDEDESRPLGRLSKLKKQSKNLKKKLKKKQRKLEKQRKMKELMQRGETLQIATPQKRLKKIKRKHKDNESGNQQALSHQAGSSQYSSESQHQDDIQNELRNLNPDAEEDPSPNKRLKKSNRKSKIQHKQGFSIDQLGNQAEFKTQKVKKHYEDESDYSFDDVNKKGKKRKPKINVPTNQQIMTNLRQHGGVVQDEGPQNQGNYDNGLDMLYSMKDKRKGAIKINNKFFSNLDFDIHNDQAPMPPPQSLQLELKPKTSNHSSSRFTFLSKVQTLKKQRGLQANIDVEAYEKKIQQKAKQSMAKAINAMSQQEFQDEIDLQVRVPTIARGKSADIINNTVYLKSFVRHKSDLPQSTNQPTITLKHPTNKKEGISRQQFYKQIQEQTRLRRSKYISEQELKNSFKKTNLGELEQARKRIQQKRRKEALSQNSQQEENGEADSKQDKIEEMIQIQERICGDIEQDDEAQSEGQKKEGEQPCQQQKKLEQVKFSVNLRHQQLDAEQKQQQGQEQEENQQQQQNQFDELASASEHQPQQQQDQPQQEQQQAEEQNNSQAPQQMEVQEQIMPESKEQDRQEMIELEEEGIMLRKRKIAETQPSIAIEHSQQRPNQEYTKPALNGKQLAQEQNQEFTNFRKLRKIAMVIANKKKVREQGRKYAAQFIEQQAEEGSDNEDHDDLVKNIDYKAEQKEYEGVDLDADLVQLIDNAVDINEEDQYEAFRKYLEDIRLKDREEIKKIIRGEFKSRHDDLELEVEEDERKRQQRMEEVMNWMKKREELQGQGIYLKPEEKEDNSDNSDSQMPYKKQKEQPQEESQQIPEEEQKAMIQRFIENTLPSAKREYRPLKLLDLGPLPQSVKLQKNNSNKTISLTKIGSKNGGQAKSAKVKKTSSLINQILNRTTISKISQNTFTGKLGRK